MCFIYILHIYDCFNEDCTCVFPLGDNKNDGISWHLVDPHSVPAAKEISFSEEFVLKYSRTLLWNSGILLGQFHTNGKPPTISNIIYPTIACWVIPFFSLSWRIGRLVIHVGESIISWSRFLEDGSHWEGKRFEERNLVSWTQQLKMDGWNTIVSFWDG